MQREDAACSIPRRLKGLHNGLFDTKNSENSSQMSNIEYHEVAKTGDLNEEEVMSVMVGDEEIALYNVEGEFYATHGICTHENIGLADGFVDGDLIECPLHAACFEIKTGKAVNPPATVDLKTYPVKIEDDTVYVGIETE